MQIEYILTTPDQRSIVQHLWQFYLYEFPYMRWHVEDSGRYADFGLQDCWERPGRDTYLIKIDGHWGGLVIVDRHARSRYGDDPQPCIEMSQFFIMAVFQGQNIAGQVAVEMFNRYRGRWEVFQLAKNLRGQAFWRKTIKAYTHDHYREIIHEEEEGVVQFFENTELA